MHVAKKSRFNVGQETRRGFQGVPLGVFDVQFAGRIAAFGGSGSTAKTVPEGPECTNMFSNIPLCTFTAEPSSLLEVFSP